jgi:diamine N-acetyltransferase
MVQIKEILTEAQLKDTLEIIRAAFLEVANEFNLTPLSAPTHPAFTTLERLSASLQTMRIFGLYVGETQAGCVAVEEAGKGIYYLQRLAVLPAYQHCGYGKRLVDFVLDYAANQGGKVVSLGMINSHTVLKDWYGSLGFVETGTKQFDGLPFTVCFMDKEVSA